MLFSNSEDNRLICPQLWPWTLLYCTACPYKCLRTIFLPLITDTLSRHSWLGLPWMSPRLLRWSIGPADPPQSYTRVCISREPVQLFAWDRELVSQSPAMHEENNPKLHTKNEAACLILHQTPHSYQKVETFLSNEVSLYLCICVYTLIFIHMCVSVVHKICQH